MGCCSSCLVSCLHWASLTLFSIFYQKKLALIFPIFIEIFVLIYFLYNVVCLHINIYIFSCVLYFQHKGWKFFPSQDYLGIYVGKASLKRSLPIVNGMFFISGFI